MVLRRFGWALMFGCFGAVGGASALPTSDFTAADNGFQQGYVFGIMEHMAFVVSSTDPQSGQLAVAYRDCFVDNKLDSREGLNIVNRYINRTPDASTRPMLGNVKMALYEACKRYMPK
jgi:hypothetical protein